jgi:hypothetical protein
MWVASPLAADFVSGYLSGVRGVGACRREPLRSRWRLFRQTISSLDRFQRAGRRSRYQTYAPTGQATLGAAHASCYVECGSPVHWRLECRSPVHWRLECGSPVHWRLTSCLVICLQSAASELADVNRCGLGGDCFAKQFHLSTASNARGAVLATKLTHQRDKPRWGRRTPAAMLNVGRQSTGGLSVGRQSAGGSSVGRQSTGGLNVGRQSTGG